MDKAKLLTQRLQTARVSREHEQAITKWHAERRATIANAPERMPMEFWCDEKRCKLDYVAMGRKHVPMVSCFETKNGTLVQVASHEPKVIRAYYMAQCERGHWNRRYITDRHLDPYFTLSQKLEMERRKAGDDLLQPSDPRFRVVYPKQWEQYQAEQEAERKRKEYMEYVESGGY